jgi:hypothetical protein
MLRGSIFLNPKKHELAKALSGVPMSMRASAVMSAHGILRLRIKSNREVRERLENKACPELQPKHQRSLLR